VLRCRELSIAYFDNIGQQVDPGNEVSGSIKIHVEQEAAQSVCTAQSEEISEPLPQEPVIRVFGINCNPTVTYEFDIFVCVAQWNEAATFLECKTSPQHEGPELRDLIVDADGITTRGDGLGSCGLAATAGSLDVSVGDPLTTWPTSQGFQGPEGIDILEGGVPDDAWTFGCNGDDLHLEEPNGSCTTGFRPTAVHDDPGDCKLLDHDNSLVNGQPVDCDLESGTFCTGTLLTDLKFYDQNTNNVYDNGEDIVIDSNNNGIFD
jgi:hypothetical protein